eukprot:TRINITY_DN52_c0_g1_i1.p1 TRINITY_DN52_c0_g1~~TRINITY_DN52_c0_g1_i1.p1  ORF type:complete len:556 (+),score=185.42 TRINITY_DN52_c0_g1_i1:247-1914(+)
MKIHNKIAFCLALTSFLLQSTYAHTYLSSVNGLAEFDTIRPERPNYERNSPIVDITSADMTCGWLPYASQPANRKLPIAAGSSLTLQFWHDGPYADDFVIDSSHRGPCIIYMAADASNPKWFKIWEMGLDSNNKFCVDYLRSNTGVNNAGKGKLTVQIPSWVPTGNYLIRTEIIALHEGYAIGKAQFYINCVELSVTNSGSSTAAVSSIPTVSFPGTYSVTDPGIFYNLYGSYLPAYIIPGPTVYKPSLTTPTTPAPSPVTAAPVTPSPSTPAPTVTYPPVTYPPTTAAPTTKPPTAPTTSPTTPTGDAIHIQIHPSATVYWLAVRIAGPSVETIKVELKDSGSYSSYTAFANTNWGYFVFGQGQVTLPASLRLTNVNGQVVELNNVITTITSGATITTSSKYGGYSAPTTSVTSAPTTSAPVTAAPVTSAPTTSAPVTAAPTSKPNAPETAGPTSTAPSVTKVQVHAGSSQWWFAVAIVDAAKTVASVQVKDSTSESKYVNLAPSDWGYWVFQSATGQPLVAPLSIRITSTVGTSLVVNNVPVTAGVVYGDSQL